MRIVKALQDRKESRAYAMARANRWRKLSAIEDKETAQQLRELESSIAVAIAFRLDQEAYGTHN